MGNRSAGNLSEQSLYCNYERDTAPLTEKFFAQEWDFKKAKREKSKEEDAGHKRAPRPPLHA